MPAGYRPTGRELRRGESHCRRERPHQQQGLRQRNASAFRQRQAGHAHHQDCAAGAGRCCGRHLPHHRHQHRHHCPTVRCGSTMPPTLVGRRHARPDPDRHARRRGMDVRTGSGRCVVVPDSRRRHDARNQPPFRRDACRQRVFENCARGSYGPAPGDDVVYPIGRACAKGGGAPTIRVEKTGDAECRIGQPCSFEITIANDGKTPSPVRFALVMRSVSKASAGWKALRSPRSTRPSAVRRNRRPCLFLHRQPDARRRGKPRSPCDSDHSRRRPPGQSAGHRQRPELRRRAVARHAGARRGRMPSGEPASVQGDRGKAYACHPFTIKKEGKKACSQGLVMNDAGRCVCPQGTTFRNGQCSSAGGTVIIPKPKAALRAAQGPDPHLRRALRLPARNRAGEPQVRADRRAAGRQCKLLPGQIRTKNGACVCPRGTEVIRGACRRAQLECAPGSRLINGRCQPIIKRRCPVGTVGQYPDCTSDPQGADAADQSEPAAEPEHPAAAEAQAAGSPVGDPARNSPSHWTEHQDLAGAIRRGFSLVGRVSAAA